LHDVRAADVTPWQALFANRRSGASTCHTCLDACIVCGSLLSGVYAWAFLRGRLDTPEHHESAEAAAIPAGSPASQGTSAPPQVRGWGAAAVTGLVAGTGLLVFTEPAWAHVLGVAALVRCAVSVSLLAAPSPQDWHRFPQDWHRFPQDWHRFPQDWHRAPPQSRAGADAALPMAPTAWIEPAFGANGLDRARLWRQRQPGRAGQAAGRAGVLG